ncbi:hypothetical protein So717_41450 [Roseobacter cerasinus]|uniref:Uncharacterized protein n=1 Tax=Roseobacter cerasinus TaxID=2602289 RepID=A0A640VXJ1_9RHOB|nr:hypothetical protein [Roseobacter cerasinus]GFE52392.1 hypothetical protein So717_41450 [Roseobacter cerasinus]
MPAPTNSCDDLPSRPTLSIDWDVYAVMLEESDMPLDQQKELIEPLWSIAVMFVDLGFDLDPVNQICGEPDDPLSDDPPDLLYLLEQDTTHQDRHEEAPWTD